MSEIVSILQHGTPDVAVEIVDRAARADDKVIFFAERSKRGADFHVVVRIKAGVHGDDCCWRAAIWEHPDEDEVGVMDPIEVRVGFDIETFCFEHLNASVCSRNVGVKLVVGVF